MPIHERDPWLSAGHMWMRLLSGPVLEEYLGTWIEAHRARYTGMVHLESIGGPGGCRLAVINAWRREAGNRVRDRLRTPFGLEEVQAASGSC